MNREDSEIAEFLGEILEHGLRCSSADCSACRTLRSVCKLVRKMLFTSSKYPSRGALVIAEGRPESASRAVSRLIKLRASRSAPALGSRSTQQRERRGHPRPLARNNSVQAESEADQKLEGYFVISQP